MEHFSEFDYWEAISKVKIATQRFSYPKWITDAYLTVLETFIGIILLLSFIYTCISIVKAITIEKEKQLKEAMKIMGLPEWLHWAAWFVNSLLILAISMILLVIALKAKWYPNSDKTIFANSNPFVIYVFLLFFACATVTYCFAISAFFSNSSTASSAAGMAWFVSFFPYLFTSKKYDFFSLTEKLLICLSSNSAMSYGFQLIIVLEGTGEGVQWHDIWSSRNPNDTFLLGHLLIMFIIDSIIYLLVAIYVENICPGEYGVPKPWYFPITALRLSRRTRHTDAIEDEQEEEEEDHSHRYNEYFEKEPSTLNIGIQIRHLKKTYSNNKTAVKDLSLNIYENQITVLLGHNGAGKTTTMSILTGIISPTSGSATISGYDIRKQKSSVRNSLGLCPQFDILFDELTVKEHLYFYSKLKGMPEEEIDEEVQKYVKLLELVPKENSLSSTLSGGMKRKLSVGIAFCGGSRVVMLDEPSAGMDPAARRALWDLLQSQKDGRTILLTTHFMDEADLLGDRIAIMAGGELQCCGSSFFLKKKYGAGYRLVIDKSPSCNANEITYLLRKHIPEIQIESNIGSELTYLLDENQSQVFEELLSNLELNFSQLGVLSYGISLTTMEEVFMKAGTEIIVKDGVTVNAYEKLTKTASEKENGDDTSLNGFRIVNPEPQLVTGCSLWRNQLLAMFMKRGLSALRSKIIYLAQICIPIIFALIAEAALRNEPNKNLPKLKIELESYGRTITPITNQFPINPVCDQFKKIVTKGQGSFLDWGDNNFSELIVKETKEKLTMVRSKYIIGARFINKYLDDWESSDDWETSHDLDNISIAIIACFNNEPYHSAPLALQCVMNSIFQVQASENHYIQMYNHPLPFTSFAKVRRLEQGTTGSSTGYLFAFNIGMAMALTSPLFIMFYVRERVSKSKHLQFVSGINVIAFWGCSFVCDLLTFMVIFLLLIVCFLIFQEDGFRTLPQLGRLLSIFFSFAFSVLPMIYLCSFLFDIPFTGYSRMTFLNILLGTGGYILKLIFKLSALSHLEETANLFHWILLVFPLYSLYTGIHDMSIIYETHASCEKMINKCLEFAVIEDELCEDLVCQNHTNCCTTTKNYYDWKAPGIGRNIVFSVLLGLILIGILMIIEYGICKKISYAMQAARNNVPPVIDPVEDSDVKREREIINSATSEEIAKYTVVTKNVVKYYKNFLAVNSLSFGVNKYECFGLLGVNGGGKTTFFKMMTGDIQMTFGNAWVNGYSLKTDMNSVKKVIGYCPQFDGLLDDLTSRETLRMFCLIRGISLKESRVTAESLAEEFDFHRHLDKRVKELSGGNKRKLSTALSLIGSPVVIYLDEPTTGLDPVTKRYLWNALCKFRDNGKSVVLTSHSMEECEALCTRLAIIVNGKFTCIGSTQHLKNKFSQGYTLTIKLKNERNSFEGVVVEEMARVEQFVNNEFPGAVKKEQHQELITFYIADISVPCSRMFGTMERGKKDLNIVDYSIGQCSLEQVFLTFAKNQRYK